MASTISSSAASSSGEDNETPSPPPPPPPPPAAVAAVASSSSTQSSGTDSPSAMARRPNDPVLVPAISSSSRDQTGRTRPRRSRSLFPARLHKLLYYENEKGNSDIISWMPGGKSFKVHDKERFEDEIMPIYFGASKYRSFTKNLNLWGFTIITTSTQRYIPGRPPRELGEVHHPMFIQDCPDLCQQMKRRGTGQDKESQVEPEQKKKRQSKQEPKSSHPGKGGMRAEPSISTETSETERRNNVPAIRKAAPQMTNFVGSGDANRVQYVSNSHQERIPGNTTLPLIPSDSRLPSRAEGNQVADAATDPTTDAVMKCIASLLGGGASSSQLNVEQDVSAALQTYLNTQQSAQRNLSGAVRCSNLTSHQNTQQDVSTALKSCLAELGLGNSGASNTVSDPRFLPSSLAALGAAFLDQGNNRSNQNARNAALLGSFFPKPQSSLQTPLEQILNNSSPSELVSIATILLREASSREQQQRQQQQQQSSQAQLQALLEGILENKK